MPDAGREFTNGLKLDPKNLEASLKALEEYMVGLRNERSSARTALRAQSEFVTTVTHEVRTSLGAIFAFSDLLIGTELNEEQYSYAYNLRSTADGLLNLLDDVLDHTKLTEGRMELSNRPFNLNELLSSFAITLEARCGAKGLSAAVDVDRELPAFLDGDPMRIRQVLMNFADNAVKFTDHGRVSLRVERVGTYQNGVIIRFSLSDTGSGVGAQERKRLFEPFEQADGSTAESHGGSGLGLSICTKLVELMGGRIGCDSEPERGSIFWFEAGFDVIEVAQPVVEQQEANVKQSNAKPADGQHDDEDLFADPPVPVDGTATTGDPEEEQHSDADPVSLRTVKPAHILVVEDNRVDQMLVATYLTKFGHTYTLAENGYDAIHTFKAGRYDLILMDVQLPELDGFQVTNAIRRLDGQRANVPIVAITANMLHARRKTWVGAGMDGCITKPIDALHLFKTIANLLDQDRVPGPTMADDDLFGDVRESA